MSATGSTVMTMAAADAAPEPDTKPTTRQRLIHAAADVVARRGYARATTREIAEVAGFAEGTIYRHFSGKDELFFAAVAELNAEQIQAVVSACDTVGQDTVVERLTDIVQQMEALERAVFPLMISAMAEPELTRPNPGASDLMPQGHPMELLRGYLTGEQELGRVRPEADAAAVASLLFGALLSQAMFAHVNMDGTQRATIADIIAVFTTGILPTES